MAGWRESRFPELAGFCGDPTTAKKTVLPRELADQMRPRYPSPVGNGSASRKPTIESGLPRLMGILNVTPDSFFDGGRYADSSESCARVDSLLAEGADLIDIGGESTRPGAAAVPASVQIERIEPALRHALARGATVSVDTAAPEVAEHVLQLGAQIINDVSCLANPALAEVVAAHQATLILMHARGSMTEMRGFSQYPDHGYHDVVEDVRREWREGQGRALAAGVARENVWFDPGLGFNKNARQSLTLLARLDEFLSEGVPIVLGASRKSFIAEVDGTSPGDRLGGSIAACLLATKLGANVLRVHDVRTTRQALLLAAAAEAVRRDVGTSSASSSSGVTGV